MIEVFLEGNKKIQIKLLEQTAQLMVSIQSRLAIFMDAFVFFLLIMLSA